MKSFRERLGIRQDFDNWAKGINNTLANLRKQGFEQAARQNINNLKAQGFQTITDKNGNEILSRANDNKKLYKEHTKQETEQIKKDLWNVKKAKEAMRQIQEQEDDEYDEDEEYEETEIDPLFYAADFYNLCEVIAQELNKIAGADFYSPGDVIDKFKNENFHGGWKNAKSAYIIKANAMIQEYKDYYSNLKNTYDDDYIDL